MEIYKEYQKIFFLRRRIEPLLLVILVGITIDSCSVLQYYGYASSLKSKKLYIISENALKDTLVIDKFSYHYVKYSGGHKALFIEIYEKYDSIAEIKYPRLIISNDNKSIICKGTPYNSSYIPSNTKYLFYLHKNNILNLSKEMNAIKCIYFPKNNFYEDERPNL